MLGNIPAVIEYKPSMINLHRPIFIRFKIILRVACVRMQHQCSIRIHANTAIDTPVKEINPFTYFKNTFANR